MRPGLLMAIDAGGHTDAASSRTEEQLTHLERMDEIVVSTIRAAVAGEVPLMMSYEPTFASLAVQVVAQYATPRHAEDIPAARLFAGPEPAKTPMRMTFVDTAPRTRPSNGRATRLAWWHALGVDAGVVAPQVESLGSVIARQGFAAALVLGDSHRAQRLVNRLASSAPSVKLYSLQSVSRRDTRVSFVDEDLHVQLADVRAQREQLDLRDPDLQSRDVDEMPPPSERSKLQPYALFAQRLVARLARDIAPSTTPR